MVNRSLRILTATGVLLGLAVLWPQRIASVPTASPPAAAAVASTTTATPPSTEVAAAPTASRDRQVAWAAVQPPAVDPAVTRFEDWTRRYLALPAAQRASLVDEGRALAAERRVVLAHMIRTDPRGALAAAVPMVVRQQLPDEILSLLEERVSGRGELALNAVTPRPGEPVREVSFRSALVGDREFRAHVFGRRDVPGSVTKTSMNGIALDGHFAVAESPVRVLEPGEMAAGRPISEVCDVSGVATPTTADTPLNAGGAATAIEYDGTVHILCGANHRAAAESRLLAREGSNLQNGAAGGPGSSGVSGRPSLAWAQGPKKLLIIRVDFSDQPGSAYTEEFIANVNRAVQDFYTDNSFGKTSLVFGAAIGGDSPDVTPVVRMPQPGSYYDGRMDGVDRSGFLHQDARNQASLAGFDVSQYDRVGVVFSGLNYWWAGLGNINGPNFWINGYYDLRVVSHEIGHNYGLWHANYWQTPSSGDPLSSAGTSIEYGDTLDMMGAGNAANHHFSHWNKSMLQWIPDDAVTTVETSGTYRVYQLDAGGANLALPRALKLRFDDNRDYWIGYRGHQPTGTAATGAYVLWGYNTNTQGNLLNVSRRPNQNPHEAPLPAGESFTDALNGITIRNVGQGGSGADRWIDVQFTFQPGVRWAQAVTEHIAGEQEGSVSLRVMRSGDTTNALSVNYATTGGAAVDGRATAGQDYIETSGTLTWAPGELAEKLITIPILSDTIWEGGERFTVTLSGASVAGNASVDVAILDAGIRDFGFLPDTPWGRVFAALVLPDGSTLVGGPFQEVYDQHWQVHARGGFARLSADGRLQSDFAAGISGGDVTVRDLARQSDGKILVAGSFESVGGGSRSNLARLHADGTLDTAFAASANGPVWTVLVQPDGRILIGGAFTSVNGVPRNRIARLNVDGTLDGGFVGPDLGGAGNFVRALALQPDGRILVGGAFARPEGATLRSGLCRLLENGSVDPAFTIGQGAHEAGFANAREVRAIVVQPDGRMLIGGTFSAYNNVPRGGIARLNADGSLDSSFTVSTNGRCNALLPLPDGRLVLGGWFNSVNGIASRNFAILSTAGEASTQYADAAGSSGEVYDFQLLANGRIQFASDMDTFQHSQEARTLWRVISGVVPSAGTVQFTAATASGAEGGNVTLAVSRTGGSAGAISVGYAATPGTATAADYGTATGSLAWADGDSATKTITIPLLSDSLAEAAESFTVTLSAPAGGATLGSVTQVTVTIQASDGPPPQPGAWTAGDIGAVGAAGGSSESGGIVTISGAGADIWETADALQFRHQQLTGDGAIVARVLTLGNTHPWAKVGLMFRENLTPGSREVMSFVSPGNNSGLQYRLEPGAQSAMGTNHWSVVPVWLMLVRAGDSFGAYRSYDGEEWTPLGTINCDLPDTAYVGLAVSSHVNGTLLSATFDNVEIIGATPPGEPPAAPTDLWSTNATASTVTLNWTDRANNETGFVIERAPASAVGYAEIAAVGANVTTYLDTGLSPNTGYNYRVRARNAAGDSAYSNSTFITTTTQTPWSSLDIGGVGVAGNQTINGGSITVQAAGADIWTGSDSFRYVYQPWRGDGEIRARVAQLDNTHPWAKAGVMFRESLASGARNVACLITAAAASGMQVRMTSSGQTTLTEGPWITAPYWVRLVRAGDTFTASTSSDGVSWTVRGTQTVPMGMDIYVGVAASSHNTSMRTTAAFEYVELGATTPPPPPPPGDWTQTVLGNGSGAFTTSGAAGMTITASGSDIWGPADGGLFVHKVWSGGDGFVGLRIESLANTHPWAKAGIMLREDLTAGSRNVFLGLTPGAGVTFQVRNSAGAMTTEVHHTWAPSAPCSLRLKRTGNTYEAAYSIDRVTWIVLGTATLGLPDGVHVGLCVSSHTADTTTAVFSDLSLPVDEPPPPDIWSQTNWGAAQGHYTKTSADGLMSFNLSTTGADIWGAADDGVFVSQAWQGAGEIRARIDSLTNTHPWAKAGLMFRVGTGAAAVNYFLGVTPSAGVVFQVRANEGAPTTEAAHSWGPAAPVWVRLSRSDFPGDQSITAFYSTNGSTWIQLAKVAESMPSDVRLGLAVSSHSASTAAVQFSSVQWTTTSLSTPP